ncbi:AGE family epimerase/isomerase [Burkholderia cepacia]|uniref:AGE family epimerase/isomerase n=1 Tax=Burkholderia cepacia TaxID=292 RepID=UPI0009BC5B20|nr:AGE family epimerase/isomerase [Burkholderia cepacia]
MSEVDLVKTEALAFLESHYVKKILSVWCGRGYNRELQLAFEAVSSDTLDPITPVRYRAMACARQLFVFALAGQIEHAASLFKSLRDRFEDKRYGGWIYGIDAQGNPSDRRKDLYTHAFVIFSTAEYARLSGDKEALSIVTNTSELILREFKVAGADSCLLNSLMSEDFSITLEGPLQNPMMHLTEAWLKAGAITKDRLYDRRLMDLVQAVAESFVHEPTGCIAEFPIGAPNNRIEPGHQFEWYAFAYESGHSAFEVSGLRGALTKAFDFARLNGVDPTTSGVYAAIDKNGRVLDSTQRIWAQTEYLRALAAHEVETIRGSVQQVMEFFRARFLHEKGWFECLSREGVVIRSDMPSTTPYHLATALSSLVSRGGPVKASFGDSTNIGQI